MRIVLSKPWGFAAPKIMRGFAEALHETGHDVHMINSQDFFIRKTADEEIRKIIEFRPDVALGYGFSAVLRVEDTHLFAMMKVPTMHYFADDPFHPSTACDLELIARDELSSIWVWDKSYVHRLQCCGLEEVHYLPLAANSRIFRKLDPDKHEKIEYMCKISFAGNGNIPERLPYLEKLTDMGLTIFGDESRWHRHSGDTAVMRSYRGFLRNEEELCALYNTARINLNITAAQGKRSANFRVFNITASGGFLLTDHKEDLEELFEIGEEIVCYRTPEELRDKAEYYLSHPGAADRIARAGHVRTLRQHTFIHRAEALLDYATGKKERIKAMATA
jgi:hypothetical protein